MTVYTLANTAKWDTAPYAIPPAALPPDTVLGQFGTAASTVTNAPAIDVAGGSPLASWSGVVNLLNGFLRSPWSDGSTPVANGDQADSDGNVYSFLPLPLPTKAQVLTLQAVLAARDCARQLNPSAIFTRPGVWSEKMLNEIVGQIASPWVVSHQATYDIGDNVLVLLQYGFAGNVRGFSGIGFYPSWSYLLRRLSDGALMCFSTPATLVGYVDTSTANNDTVIAGTPSGPPESPDVLLARWAQEDSTNGKPNVRFAFVDLVVSVGAVPAPEEE